MLNIVAGHKRSHSVDPPLVPDRRRENVPQGAHRVDQLSPKSDTLFCTKLLVLADSFNANLSKLSTATTRFPSMTEDSRCRGLPSQHTNSTANPTNHLACDIDVQAVCRQEAIEWH